LDQINLVACCVELGGAQRPDSNIASMIGISPTALS